MGASAKGTWDSRFTLPPGLNGPVEAMVSMGRFLVVGGSFSRAGGVEAHGIALWDGSRWWPLGGAGVDGPVYALALSNDGLYVGGVFSHAGGKPANNVAKWNGVSWDSMGGGVKSTNVYSGGVFALYVQQGSVYVGGSFSQAGNLPALNIASWDGRTWHRLGVGVSFSFPLDPLSSTGSVGALAGDGVNLYVGGAFRYAGNAPATNLACWNGRDWRAIGGTVGGGSGTIVEGFFLQGQISTVAVYQNNLYVAGDFFGIGGVAATNFARWDGRAWWSIPGSEGASVSLLKAEQGNLYVAGLFDHMGYAAATNLAVLRNGVWSGMTAEIPGSESEYIQSLTIIGNTLYAGGGFGLFNGRSVGHIVKFEQGAWKAVGAGTGNSFDNQVSGLAVQGDTVYAAGYFQSAGMNVAAGMAKWDGGKWSAIAPVVTGFGQQIGAVGTNIYVAGDLNLPGIGPASLACWNGTEWSTLPGIETNRGTFTQLLKVGEMLCVNGWAYNPALESVLPICSRWDGTNWAPGPIGVISDETRLATDQISLYVARSIYQSDIIVGTGTYKVQVEKWNEMNSEMIGRSIEGLRADALAVSGEQVYLAGRWTTNYNHSVLFRWDGNQWKQMIGFSKQDGFVSSMVVMGRNLYVGGKFDSIAGVPVNNIAQWDGSRWRSLGSGLQDGANGSSLVWSMVGFGGKLYVGGNFGTAGGKESGNFGIWTEEK